MDFAKRLCTKVMLSFMLRSTWPYPLVLKRTVPSICSRLIGVDSKTISSIYYSARRPFIHVQYVMDKDTVTVI